MTQVLEQDAQAFNNSLKSQAPQMVPANSTTVKLIRGIQNPLTGEWQDECQVRELTGEDEEALSTQDAKVNLSYSEYMSMLLRRSVISIGDIVVADAPDVIDSLIIGDRDILFLGTIQATYGRYKELIATCGSCNESSDIKVDLKDDFKVDAKDQDLRKPLEITLKNGETILLNYATGGDSQYVNKKAKTTAEQNTLMLARCAIFKDNAPADREDWARKLSLADRNKMVKALLNNQPGPQMEVVKTQCANCKADMPLALDWVSLLFG